LKGGGTRPRWSRIRKKASRQRPWKSGRRWRVWRNRSRQRRLFLWPSGGSGYTRAMRAVNAAEVAGFAKLARLSAPELRKLFIRSGAGQGAFRGALAGGALGYYGADPDDGDSLVSRVGSGVLAGGLAGALFGGLQGAHVSKEPFRKTISDDGTVMIHLRNPGRFRNEVIYAKYPFGSGRPEFTPSVGTSLLAKLVKTRTLPSEVL
jgi:hypothetical protein